MTNIHPDQFEVTRYTLVDHVATITLDRPHRRNALNPRAYAELEAAFLHVQADPEVRCVIVTGAEASFCSGEDVVEMLTGKGPAKSAALPRVRMPVTPAAMAALNCDDWTWPHDTSAALRSLPAGHAFAVPENLFRKITDEERADWQSRFAGIRA